MTGRRYYITSIADWQRHAHRFANSHWVALDESAIAPAAQRARPAYGGPLLSDGCQTHLDAASDRVDGASDATTPGTDTPAAATRVLALIEADEGSARRAHRARPNLRYRHKSSRPRDGNSVGAARRQAARFNGLVNGRARRPFRRRHQYRVAVRLARLKAFRRSTVCRQRRRIADKPARRRRAVPLGARFQIRYASRLID